MPRKPKMSGIFDWLRRSAPPLPGSKSQLPILRESMLPAAPRREEKKLTPFSIFSPKPPEPRGMVPVPAFFKILTPPPPPPAPPKPREEEKPKEEFWEKMFTPSQEEEAPAGEMFEFLKPETVREAAQYPHTDTWIFGEPPLWSDTRWAMPTTFELAEMIHQKWDLPKIWENVLNMVDTPYWKQKVEESSHTQEPAEMIVDQITNNAVPAYGDMGNFLNIPDYVIERYGLYGHDGLNRLTHEVFMPMIERVGKALDVLRPTRKLRGWFELEPDKKMDFYLLYKEAKFMPQEG